MFSLRRCIFIKNLHSFFLAVTGLEAVPLHGYSCTGKLHREVGLVALNAEFKSENLYVI